MDGEILQRANFKQFALINFLHNNTFYTVTFNMSSPENRTTILHDYRWGLSQSD